MQDIILKVQNLSKNFFLHLLDGKQITVFENISFSLKRGEFLGIAGKSGAGKSTLLKCIYRTYLSTSGNIIFYPKGENPVDLACCSDQEVIDLRHKKIGYVSQFLQVIPRVNCLEIVAQSLIQQGSKNKAEIKAKNILSRLLIPEKLLDAFPSTFSGGEKQRVNIAHALIKQTDLLLIDEPTASLDKGCREIVLEMIEELKERGISVISIFHNEKELKRFADKILIMENGELKGG